MAWDSLTLVIEKQGISSRFLNFFNGLDHTVGSKVVGENQTVSGKLTETAQSAYAKTKEVDQNRGVSARVHEYYSKAIGTGVGQKVHSFYTTTSKQVLDVHEEARRIAVSPAFSGIIANRPDIPVSVRAVWYGN